MDRIYVYPSLLRNGWISVASRERFFSWLRYWGPLLVALGLAAIAFNFLKHCLYEHIASHASPAIITLGISTAAISGIWLSPHQLTPAARIFYRVSSLLVGFYLIAGDVPMPTGADAAIVEWFNYASLLALAAAVLSFWRPTLALIPFGLLVMQKGLHRRSGAYRSHRQTGHLSSSPRASWSFPRHLRSPSAHSPPASGASKKRIPRPKPACRSSMLW